MNGLTSKSSGAKGAAGPGATETPLRTLVDQAQAGLARGETKSEDHLRSFMTRLRPKGHLESLTGQNSMKSYLKTISPNELMDIVDNYDTLKPLIASRVDTSSQKGPLTQSLCKALLEGCALSLLGEKSEAEKTTFLADIRKKMPASPEPIGLQTLTATGAQKSTFATINIENVKTIASELFADSLATAKSSHVGSSDASGGGAEDFGGAASRAPQFPITEVYLPDVFSDDSYDDPESAAAAAIGAAADAAEYAAEFAEVVAVADAAEYAAEFAEVVAVADASAELAAATPPITDFYKRLAVSETLVVGAGYSEQEIERLSKFDPNYIGIGYGEPGPVSGIPLGLAATWNSDINPEFSSLVDSTLQNAFGSIRFDWSVESCLTETSEKTDSGVPTKWKIIPKVLPLLKILVTKIKPGGVVYLQAPQEELGFQKEIGFKDTALVDFFRASGITVEEYAR